MVKVTLKPITDGLKAVDLPIGKTVLGRGPLLGCTDKKVSRNHAVLDVTAKGAVFLTPIHVNPCFYRTKSDDVLKTMKKDHVQQLYPGDIISLLPHTFEYEICLETSAVRCDKEDLTPVPIKQLPNPPEEELTTNREVEPTAEDTQIEKNDKSEEVLTNNETTVAKEKETLPENNKKTPPSEDEKIEEEEEEEEEKDEVEEEAEKEELKEQEPEDKSKRKKETVKPESSKAVVRHRRTLPSWLLSCIRGGGAERVEKKAHARVAAPVASTPARSRPTKTSSGDTKQSVSRSSRQNRQTRQKISLEDFVVSEDDQWNSESSEKPGGGGRSKSDSDWASENSSGSDWELEKKRKRRGGRGGDSSESDWGATNLRKRRFRRDDSDSASDWETENRKKVIKKSKGRKTKKKSESEESNDENGPRRRATTSQADDSKKRTPCMYGKKCYRRQQQHIAQFSHPGDSDYESDGDGAKKECPYGVDCYRKNTQHRKEFTHTKKVRPTREAAKKAGKKKTTNEDDDEEDDGRDLSFENDSDAYAPGSEASGASDTEDLVKDSKKVLMNRDRKKAV